MEEEDFNAFKQAWLDYPSQDNEGYVPSRGAFKAGWFAALCYERSKSKLKESSVKKLRPSICDECSTELPLDIPISFTHPETDKVVEICSKRCYTAFMYRVCAAYEPPTDDQD